MINISDLTAEELDELIARASTMRAKISPEISMDVPSSPSALINPAWYVNPTEKGLLFQVRHPGLGWLAFVIPPNERINMLTLLLQQTLFDLSGKVK